MILIHQYHCAAFATPQTPLLAAKFVYHYQNLSKPGLAYKNIYTQLYISVQS